MRPITIGPIASEMKLFRGQAARIATLLLLFGFLAPLTVTPDIVASPGNAPSLNASSSDAAGEINAAVLPGNARASERLFGLPGLSNVGRVAPGILRGAQPGPEGYETLRKMGIKTVINLRSRHGEKKAVEAKGLRSVEIPMDAMKNVDPAAVRKVLSVMVDPANQPVFVHCTLGKDRTGVVVAVYRMEVEGWSEAEAEAEMDAFGFHEVWFRLKKFVRRFQVDRKENKGDHPVSPG